MVKLMKIYRAGPLFITAEREFNIQLANRLRERGYQVWLPQECEQRDKTAQEVFRKDLEGLDWANVVVANMDGADPGAHGAYVLADGARALDVGARRPAPVGRVEQAGLAAGNGREVISELAGGH